MLIIYLGYYSKDVREIIIKLHTFNSVWKLVKSSCTKQSPDSSLTGYLSLASKQGKSASGSTKAETPQLQFKIIWN